MAGKKDIKSTLEELIELNEKLNSTPFNPTSLERLEELSAKVSRNFENLNKTLESSNQKLTNVDAQYSNLFKDSNRLVEDICVLQDEIDTLSKGTDDQKKKSKELKKVLAEILGSAEKYYSTANKQQEVLNKRIVDGITFFDDWNEKWEQRTRALRKGFGEINNGAKQMYHAITNTLKPWTQANDAAMKYARTMGMSQKSADAYLAKTVTWASKNDIGLLFNKSTDELIKMQGKFSEVLGRNIQLTSEQKKDMLAMEKFLGEEGMVDIANNLENFGLGMSDSANFVKKTFDTATKSGIAASKLTQTIRENIKMAQNYSFKNGLDGLTSMAKKAISLKTDMSFINGLIDKVSTVEGAITTGANLQVLGGSYAMGSDPLSMLHDSLNNVEGLFDKAVGMAKGKVYYNNQTGNFEMGAMDRYLMKQAATQMGIDPSKMIDVAFRQASLSKIEAQAKTNSKISNDSDMLELVKNLATWDNGKAVVDIDGKAVNVSDLSEKDKEKLQAMQRNDSQNLQDMAISLRSINEILEGTGKEINNEQASMIDTIREWFNDLLRSNTKTLNVFSKIGATINVITGTKALLGGILGVTTGILRSINGTGNLFRGLGNTGKSGGIIGKVRGSWRGMAGNTITSRSGITWKSLGGGRFVNTNNPSQVLSGTNAQNMIRGGSKMKLGTLGKTLKYGSVVGAGALSLGVDALDGTLQKDTGASLGKAAAVTVGAAIGSVVPVVGSVLGGMIAGAIADVVQDTQKKNRAKIREQISSNLDASMSHLSGLFVGENALQGNYSESQLNKIKEILQDNKIDESELSGFSGRWLKRLLRNNGDLTRMRDAGVNVQVAMASGGRLKGNSHANGGMPILGSNIVVEGGEYVVNKQATEANLPLLEAINSNNYKMTAKEPLGKQMKVANRAYNESLLTPYNSKINIEPISINLSGTIKLESGNRQIDISNDILNSPVLVTKLTEMISKQLNILDYGAYNKGKFKQKFT